MLFLTLLLASSAPAEEALTKQEAHQLKVLTQELLDRHKIGDLLTSYATAVDSNKWDLYQDCFTSDAVIDYTAAGGGKGNPAEMATWLNTVFNRDNWVYLNRQMHVITNVEISRTGKDKANVRAAFYAPMSISFIPFEYGPTMSVGGWYTHTLVKSSTDGKWRSSSLKEEIAYNQTPVHVTIMILVIVFGFRAISGVLFNSNAANNDNVKKKI